MTIINLLTQPSVFYLILIPLIGVFVILFINTDKNISINRPLITEKVSVQNTILQWLHLTGHNQNQPKGTDTVLYNIALFFSLLNLLVSVILWYFFNNSTSAIEAAMSQVDPISTSTWLSSSLANFTESATKAVPILNQVKGDILTTPTFSQHVSEFEIGERVREIGTQFQFIFEINHFSFGVDGISIFFVLLTTFITPIAIFSSYELYGNFSPAAALAHTTPTSPAYGMALGRENGSIIAKGVQGKELFSNDNPETLKLKIFLISLLLLESLQICAFVSLDLLLFYVFFESVLPVLFILIVVFGHGENRFRSAFLLFLYTLAGSLPMLLSILTIYAYLGSTDYQLISFNEISLESQKLLWLGFFIALAVKTPLVPFSIWLPKAHGDSPLAGSIILAATILKLATYFYLRVLINYLPDASNYFSPMVQTIAVISIIYASLATIVQEDTKRLIAYSSVAHMGVVVLGLFSNTLHGIEGAILLSLAHGWVSPALFICVGGIVYERTGTRIIYYIRGLANIMPIFTIMFFLFTLANTGIPLSLNFLGEQLALMGIWEVNPIVAALGASGILLSACYSLFLMNRLSYGDYSPYLYPVKDLNRREYHLLLALIIPTFFFGIFPNVILDGLHMVGTSLLYN